MSRKGFAAALLLAALSARAQVEIRPSVALPSAPAVFSLPCVTVLAPALTSVPLAAPFFLPAAAPTLAPVPAAVVEAAPAAAAALATPAAAAEAAQTPQAHAAAISEALAGFARLDLGAAPAGAARDAGEALMLRALGAAADGPTPVAAAPPDFSAPSLAPAARPAAPARPRLYLLSQPLHETVTLGPVALAAHVLFEAGWDFTKGWIAWHATHSPAAVAAVMCFELATSPVSMIPVRSLLDLSQRYWRRKLAVLRELAGTPGVDRVRVLTTGKVEFFGLLARSKDNTGLIFVESSSALPETIGRFGSPIPIADAEAQHVRLTVVAPGANGASVWSPTLSHLLEGRPIPPGVAAAWRAALNRGKAPIKRLFAAAKASSLRIDATLVGPDGTEKPLGAIAAGPAVRTLAGLGFIDRARARLGLARATRRLPVSDTLVRRPGDARAPGWAAALGRAWRRATGRLIVAKG